MTGVVLVVASSPAVLALLAFAVSLVAFLYQPQGTSPQGDGPWPPELSWYWSCYSAQSPTPFLGTVGLP